MSASLGDLSEVYQCLSLPPKEALIDLSQMHQCLSLPRWRHIGRQALKEAVIKGYATLSDATNNRAEVS
jgi:hypothetical protein